MNKSLPPIPLSPSVGARRKGGKVLPSLPPSAFTPPASGISDNFPLAPSPSTLVPAELVDAHVRAVPSDLAAWRAQLGPAIAGKAGAVVLSLQGREPDEIDEIVSEIRSGSPAVPVLAVLVPVVNGGDEATFTPPPYLAETRLAAPKLVPSFVFTKNDAQIRQALEWALKEGLTVNIDVQCDVREAEGGWDALEELLTTLTSSRENKQLQGKIVISNILPPPDDLSLPIVKLLTHTSYRNYQLHTAALSLLSNVFLNYLPPAWGTSVPSADATKECAEWKRRIKMFISPAVEAFGIQRIIFGSSPSSPSQQASNVNDWYELARESFAELGIEQDAIDAVFSGNAKSVYGS